MNLNKLNSKIQKVFSIYSTDLNAKLTKCELQSVDDIKYYEVPLPSLSDGGATVIIDGSDATYPLEAPAKAEFSVKKVHPQYVNYRIVFDAADAAKAEEDDSYFNLLVEPVIRQAISRYENSFGGRNTLRYGQTFCSIPDVTESGEYVEMRLVGNWASSKEL